MLTTTTRTPTKAELDAYAELMADRGSIFSFVLIIAILAGIAAALFSVGVLWLGSLFDSGGHWKAALIVGGAAALLTVGGIFAASRADSEPVTMEVPAQATEIAATADAAWETDPDSLHTTLVMRVQPDCYLLLTQDAWTPPIRQKKPPGTGPQTLPSNIHAVLMGEGKFRVAANVSLDGPIIPKPTVNAIPSEDDPDGDNSARFPDGLYTAAELPRRIREAIGLDAG